MKIGRYQVDPKNSSLGAGGMGVVYRAYDAITKRDVAIKTMLDTSDPIALEMFSKEWEVLAKLSHPNIVDILDTDTFEDRGVRKPFFVMPLLPGQTLGKMIEEKSPRLTVASVVEIIAQACRGLQAAHEHGLIHRDIKPSNIFVMNDDTVKIIDFGVAHLANSKSATGIKGTLQYMAPEQLELKPATPLSDVFALGVVSFEALTGRKPFARATEGETAEAVRKYIPPPASDINPSVSQLIAQVVHKAMAKQPWHRFSTARDYSDALQKAVRGEAIERFDRTKLQPRIERAKRAAAEGDHQFADEILNELEAEGNTDPEMTVLRGQIGQAVRQKTIRHLLDSARTRKEEEEYPLALQKLLEVLQLDPQNVDALSMRKEIETQRSEKQIENWYRLVAQHLENSSFAQARQALDEVLKISPNSPRAVQQLAEVNRREQEVNQVRNEKEQLYQNALRDYQAGEVTTALSKLQRVIQMKAQTQDSGMPERDALYENLYNEVRTEQECLKNAYQEGKRYLADRNFEKALEACEQCANKYPDNAIFQALKLEIEEQQRQDQSSYIAEISRRVDAEPDLDRRVSILKEASERYPEEPHFGKSMKLVKERRDLVNAIVGRAHQYEERGQYSEALGQFDILRSIYGQYPGLEFEVERLVRRREQQSHEEAKSKVVEQIDRTLERGDFVQAMELVSGALKIYKDDGELNGLERLARQGLGRSDEAQRWLNQGQKLCAERKFGEGLEALRKGTELSPANPVIRAALLTALVEQGRSLLAEDWRAAEPLIQEALDIDPAHAQAKSLRTLVQDHKRQEFLSQALEQVRELQAKGDLVGAWARADEAAKSYPNEPRLKQIQNTLRNSLGEGDLRTINAKAAQAGTNPQDQLIAEAARVQAQHPSDPEMAPVIERLKQTQQPPEAVQGNSLFLPMSHAYAAEGAAVAGANETSTNFIALPPQTDGPKAPEPEKAKPSSPKVEPQVTKQQAPKPPVQPAKPLLSRLSPSTWGVVLAVPLLIVIGIVANRWYRQTPSPKPPQPAGRVAVPFQIAVDPPGASLLVDRQRASSPLSLSEGPHTVLATLAGYKTETQQIRVKAGMTNPRLDLKLVPEKAALRLSTDVAGGQVQLDQETLPLEENGFNREEVPFAEHTFKILDHAKDLVALRFNAQPGKAVEVTGPVQSKDLAVYVVSQFGNRAIVYGNRPEVKASYNNGPWAPIGTAGLPVDMISADGQLSIDDGKQQRPIPLSASNAPALSVFAFGANDKEQLTLKVANVEHGFVLLDGRKKKVPVIKGNWTSLLEPKLYRVQVQADGFENSEIIPVDLKKGQPKVIPITMKAVPKLAGLVIQGGTPEAEIWMNDSRIGSLDANGSFKKEDITPGEHSGEFRKENYSSVPWRMNFVAGQPVNLSEKARLRPLGLVEFKPAQPDTKITYWRATESEERGKAVDASNRLRISEGAYEYAAEAPGYERATGSFPVPSGRPAIVEIKLVKKAGAQVAAVPKQAVTSGFMEDPKAWTQEGDWLVSPKGYGWMRSSSGAFKFQALRQKTGLFKGSKKVEWVANYKSKNSYVLYTLDEKHLSRRVLEDGRDLYKETKNHEFGKGEFYSFSVAIEPGSIVVRDGTGAVVDSFNQPGTDLTAGKFGFKGESAIREVR